MPDDQKPLSLQTSKNVPLWVRIVSGAATSMITAWVLNHASLTGVNFETLGVNSEIIKASIDGAITGVAVAPVEFLVGIIISARIIWRQIKNAYTGPLPPEDKE